MLKSVLEEYHNDLLILNDQRLSYERMADTFLLEYGIIVTGLAIKNYFKSKKIKKNCASPGKTDVIY